MSIIKKEKFIRDIKADFEKEKNTKSYERVKRMAKTISENLYSEDSHFIYELIQNAQDNSYVQDITRKLDFHVSANGILIKNNEKGFEESHIESICDFNDSTKSKKKALGYIGEKGIGFKSVFAITDNPAIHSNGYKFYFKKDEYIEPYWISSLDQYPIEFKDNGATNIYLPYSKTFENKEDIEKKIKDIEPILLLFLDNLDEINIYNKEKQILSVSKTFKVENEQNITIIESKKSKDQFVVYSKEIDCRKDIKREKREGVEKRKLILAFPVDEIDDTRLFSFLPTEINTGLPFLIQSDFLLTASRGEILKNKEWNKWLLEEIVDFFVETFVSLQSVDNLNYLKYLDQEDSSNRFLDKYYQSMLDKLQYKKLFLSIKDEYVSSSQICILDDYEFMYKYLQDVTYENDEGVPYSYLNEDFHIPKYLINKWKITTIDKKEFLNIIGTLSEFFSEKFKEDNILFEQLLEYIGKDYKIKKYLLALPVIPFDDGDNIIFKTKKELNDIQIFFKLDNDGVLNNVFSDLKIISKKYQENLYNIPFYSDIFEVKQPDIVEILKSLENDDDFFTNINDNINLLVYIKNNYLGESQKQIIERLADNYQFISKKNYLVEHKYREAYSWSKDSAPEFSTTLYISKEYLNSENSIEKIVNRYCTEQGKENIDFISKKYLEYDKISSNKELKDLQKEWRDFFDELKINDDCKLIDEELEMWDIDSQYNRRFTTEHLQNIPFIASPIFESSYDKNHISINLNIKDISKNDSIFLFKKFFHLIGSGNEIESSYRRVRNYYREFKYDYITAPWIEAIQDEYPIFIEDKKYTVKEFYVDVDKKLQNFFYSLPVEYFGRDNYDLDGINEVFNLEKEPGIDSILGIIRNKSVIDFKDIKSIFLYIHYTFPYGEIGLDEIPILHKDKIVYVSLDKLIWKDGKELKLSELEASYGSDFKKFFLEQLGIQEKPTIEQYIEHLKTKPKNHTKIFNKFVIYVDELIDNDDSPDIEDEKIFLIHEKLFSIDEIIFNDEGLKTSVIPNLFNVNQKYLPTFEKIVNEYQVDKISDYGREIQTFNAEDNEGIQDVYIKLLNFTWDYIFSKNQKKFEELTNDKEFILETKNVILGAKAEIVLKIDVDGKYIDVEQDIAILDDTIYLSKSIDERKIGTEISKYIVKKVGIDFEKIERFYDKVYRINDYSKDEYYDEERLEEPKDDDRFDVVFEKLLNAPIDNENNDFDEEDDSFIDIDDLENEDEENEKNKISISVVNKPNSGDNNPIKPSVNNDKVICPECNVEINKKNLEKHLCKVHHQNCGDSNANNLNDPNTQPNLSGAIKGHEGDVDKDNDDIDPSIVNDEEAFRKKAQQQLLKNLGKSRKVYKTSQTVKVGKKETKDFLKNQYKGYCQICGFTFDQKNFKGKYFEIFDWLSEKVSKQKTNIVDAGSSLCLCSRCHSGLKYGDFEANFLSKLNNIDLSSFTFDDFTEKTNTIVEEDKIPKCYDFIEMDMYKISIRLLHEEENIYFTEEHFLHFYNLLTLNGN